MGWASFSVQYALMSCCTGVRAEHRAEGSGKRRPGEEETCALCTQCMHTPWYLDEAKCFATKL